MIAGHPTFPQIFRAQKNVLTALMLRDIKTRFGSAPGFLIAIAWPLSHIMLLVGINILAGRIVPYGESAVLWFALGTTPFMIVSYTSRFMMYGLILNRPLLAFPAISVFDIMLSRILIEMFVSSCLIACLILILSSLGVDFMPVDLTMALSALGVSLLLGIGFGILNSIMSMLMTQWATVYMLLTIFLWITSGAYFVPSAMPAALRELMYWHPILHCIEWIREAYFEGYHSLILDKYYVVGVALATIFMGLLLERLLRGRILSS
jgi:capsular polysaccharide transport system permease protein